MIAAKKSRQIASVMAFTDTNPMMFFVIAGGMMRFSPRMPGPGTHLT
jgi:hypothetical protein